MNAASCRRFQERKHEPAYRARRTAASNRFKERVKADPEKSAAVSAQAARWRDKNRPRMAAANRAYRMANADKVREKNQRRRARLLDAYVAPVDPAAIWERDGGVCQICHEPVDAAALWPDRWCGTIDHIIPLSRHGTHEPGNVQLAHHTCNSRKNDRLLA